jgi:hypothetical protein
MKPVSCSVEWYEGYSNDPRLQIVIDEYPKGLRYEHKQESLWFAEKDGYVSFYSWKGPGDEEGYCGRCYPITTINGEEVTLRGPWSSRSGVMNKYFTPQCLDVSIKTVEKLNSCWCAGAVTLEFALEAIKLCEESIELVVKESHGEYLFVPRKIVS